jgi:hypothetical protein
MDVNWPVITLLIGWGGNELSQYLRSRQSHRSELCRAISVLLEIRYVLRVSEEVITLLSERANIDRSSIAVVIRPILLAKFISPTSLANYEKAIDAIAAYDPLMAHDLTGRQRVPEAFAMMGAFPGQAAIEAKAIEPAVAHFSSSLSDFAANAGIPTIEACILNISWHASKKLWWDCRRRFRAKGSIIQSDDPSYKFISSQIDELIKVAIATDQAATVAQAKA